MRVAFAIGTVVLLTSLAEAADLGKIASRALAARQRTMQADATAADLDAFLAFMTEDVVYEDPVVPMRIQGKAQIREGMAGFLGASRRARVVVTKEISAANVVVVEQDVSFDAKEKERWIATKRRQVTVLEFDAHSKIRRLADYWAR